MSAETRFPVFQMSTREMEPSVLRLAAIRKLPSRVAAKAEVVLPAAPGLVNHFVDGLNATWLALGRTFSTSELERLRQVLAGALEQAYEASPYSRVLVAYETDAPPKTSLSWHISIRASTIEDEYAAWVASRTAPLFGSHPDAKVMDLARALGAPSEVAILDVGAGTGRNTIALAAEGFRIDAVELAPSLARILREEVACRSLVVRVYEGDILDPDLPIPAASYDMMLLAEVVASHFRTARQIRALFEAAQRLLKADGVLLFSVFTALDGYEPDDVVRQMSQIMWCPVFPRREFQDAAGLPFVLVSDECTSEYERNHLPPEHWPPTDWYEGWAAGQNLFDVHAGRSPVELRWLVFRKIQPA